MKLFVNGRLSKFTPQCMSPPQGGVEYFSFYSPVNIFFHQNTSIQRKNIRFLIRLYFFKENSTKKITLFLFAKVGVFVKIIKNAQMKPFVTSNCHY